MKKKHVWMLLVFVFILGCAQGRSLPDQAPVIAIHCGFDEMGRSFGYFYIRPVANEENGSLQDTVDKRIVYNGYNNSNSYAEWLSLSNDYWYQGTTAMVLLNK